MVTWPFGLTVVIIGITSTISVLLRGGVVIATLRGWRGKLQRRKSASRVGRDRKLRSRNHSFIRRTHFCYQMSFVV